MDDNQITSLPESFGNMVDLYKLWVNDNQLTTLPESFGNLESLFIIYINNNQLVSLSENFGDLDNLSQIWAFNNQLTSLPESFGDLESLDSVYLVNNLISGLPANWGDLDDLNLMDLSYNQINELPESFGDMETIEAIYLDVNQLSTLPASFADLSSLISCSFALNQFETFPENIVSMADLQILNFNQNQISSIPESIENMMGLQALGLSANLLETLPETFGNLDIPILILNNNNLTKLPGGLLDNSYEYLYIQENALQFGTIEPLMGHVVNFEYIPQDMIGNDTTLTAEWGTDFSYTIDVSGEYNIYKWYKNGVLMPDQTTNTLNISSVNSGDLGTYVLKVTNSLVTGLELVSYDVVLGIITGFEENEVSGFKLYPNPVTTTVNISFDDPQEIDNIAIYNISGQLMLNQKVNNSQVQMDVSSFGKGLFIVKISYTNGQITSEKFIVK